MILANSILDELEHQAKIQGRKNYSGVEVDYRTLLAMVKEIKENRNASFGLSIVSGGTRLADCSHNCTEDVFNSGDKVLYRGNECEFFDYAPYGKAAVKNKITKAISVVDLCDVRRMVNISQ